MLDPEKQKQITNAIALNLVHHRKRLGTDQQQLVEKSGVSITTVYLLEHGKTKSPGIITLLSLCDALGVELLDLLESKPERQL